MSTDLKPYLQSPRNNYEDINFNKDVSNYFGLIEYTVLPPRGLFHPVLPYHAQDKLMFALCKTCADTGNQTPCTHSDAERAIQGTWSSVEVMNALEKGYRIVQLHKVWRFPQKPEKIITDQGTEFFNDISKRC